MAPNDPNTLLSDSDNPQVVETTPLVSQQTLAAKRVRSYTNTLNFLPNRRLRSKFRSTKPFDKTRTNTFKANERDFHESSHPVDLPSSSASCQGCSSSTAYQSSYKVPQQDPLKLLLPWPSFNYDPMSDVSLTLANTGSVARDHLASERTFLAYVRTSLALASSGVGELNAIVIYYFNKVYFDLALVQFFTVAAAHHHNSSGHRLHIYIRPLGATTIATGLVVLIIGTFLIMESCSYLHCH